MKFDLKTVVLEGVDCSGKTTAFRNIHKLTGFKWNIHDRSTLSMLCYAVMYNRDVTHWRGLLQEEFNDLNHVVVIMMPPVDVIKERLAIRGDEFQDQETIVKLYDIFEREVARLFDCPNVLVVRRAVPDYAEIAKWLLNYERQSYTRIADMIHATARRHIGGESVFVKAAWEDAGFNTLRTKALHYEPEIEYYNTTSEKLIKKIKDELAGLNEYESPQSVESRRFILSQESCISYAHFLYRSGVLYANIVCRSSEVSRIFPNDVHFIGHLGKIARQHIGLDENTPVKFSLTLDSAHVIFQPTH